MIMGGGERHRPSDRSGLVDELRLHIAPMLLGGGTPIFRPGTRQLYRQRESAPFEQRHPRHLRTGVGRKAVERSQGVEGGSTTSAQEWPLRARP